MAASNRALEEETAERLEATAALNLKTSESNQLLSDSRCLEDQLQTMARQILSANETERKRMSLRLNDDIAQTSISLTLIDTRFRITAVDDQFVISAEKPDLPAASWVPLINHVEPVLGKPTN